MDERLGRQRRGRDTQRWRDSAARGRDRDRDAPWQGETQAAERMEVEKKETVTRKRTPAPATATEAERWRETVTAVYRDRERDLGRGRVSIEMGGGGRWTGPPKEKRLGPARGRESGGGELVKINIYKMRVSKFFLHFRSKLFICVSPSLLTD